jgi:ATP-dependent protease ClpP protease subunit
MQEERMTSQSSARITKLSPETETQTGQPAAADLLFRPNISLNGSIDAGTLAFFMGRLEKVRGDDDDLRMELNTLGGDADIARRIALEIGLFRHCSERRACCVGKTNVYSAGVTIFAAFTRDSRFLTKDAVLLIHERSMQQTVELSGPTRANIQVVQGLVEMMKTAERLEREGFEQLVEGSDLTMETLYERALQNWYINADEALKHGLISRVLC